MTTPSPTQITKTITTQTQKSRIINNISLEMNSRHAAQNKRARRSPQPLAVQSLQFFHNLLPLLKFTRGNIYYVNLHFNVDYLLNILTSLLSNVIAISENRMLIYLLWPNNKRL